jgi:hypothetical protein
VEWQWHWRLGPMKKFCNLINFLQAKHVSPIEIQHSLIEMYDEGIMRVQHDRTWRRKFKNCWTGTHDGDHVSWPNTSRMDVKAAWVEELILGKQMCHNPRFPCCIGVVSWNCTQHCLCRNVMHEPDFYHNWILKLMPGWEGCVSMVRDYAEK